MNGYLATTSLVLAPQVLHGAITEEVQEAFGSPILSKKLYINRLFTNTVTGRTRTDVYLMVTTRVLADKGTIDANREHDK